MTSFNLTSYLLNENLNSTIMYNEILREPSGFFKIFNHTNNTNRREERHNVASDIIDIDAQCKKCIATLFETRFLDRRHIVENLKENDGVLDISVLPTPKYGPEYAILKLSDDMIKKVNIKYNQLIQRLIKKANNYDKQPHGNVLRMLLSSLNSKKFPYLSDLANLTDSNFKKYTFDDIKKMGGLPNGSAYFWFKGDKRLLCISDNTYILLENPLVSTDIYEYNKHLQNDNIAELKKNVIYATLKTKLRNGEIIEWPLTTSFDNYHTELVVPQCNRTFQSILSRYQITQIVATKYGYHKQKKLGDPTKSTSNIRKLAKWGGKGSDDYVIVLRFNKSLNKNELSNHADFTTNISQTYSKKRHKDYEGSATETQYKWSTDRLLLLLPYRVNDKLDKQCVTVLDENGKFKVIYVDSSSGTDIQSDLNNEIPYFATNTDTYNKICRQNNLNRYQSLRSLITTKKEVLHLLLDIKGNQSVVSELLSEMNMYISRFKEVRKTLSPEDKNNATHTLYYTLASKLNGFVAAQINAEITYDKLIKQCVRLEEYIQAGSNDNATIISALERHKNDIAKQLISTQDLDEFNHYCQIIKGYLYNE